MSVISTYKKKLLNMKENYSNIEKNKKIILIQTTIYILKVTLETIWQKNQKIQVFKINFLKIGVIIVKIAVIWEIMGILLLWEVILELFSNEYLSILFYFYNKIYRTNQLGSIYS